MTINRTHGNTQYFLHKYSKNMDYLSILESSFYYHTSDDSSAVMELHNYASYLDFVRNANTTLLYRLNHWKLGVGYFSHVPLDGKSKVTHLVGLKAIKKIFGIGIEYADETKN